MKTVMVNKLRLWVTAGVVSTSLLSLAGCHVDMWVQPKVKPYAESDFFADGQSARPLVAGTVARHVDADGNDIIRTGNAFYTGIDPTTKKLVDTLPPEILAVDKDLKTTLHRGRERFEIYCAPCHGRLGDGQGMIAQRGFSLRKPVGNYHTTRLRRMPLGHYYDVMTNGFGVMYSYASRVDPDDRWRIAAYIRVLQYSQNVKASDVPADKQGDLDANSLTTLATKPLKDTVDPPGGEAETK
jgi:mono/diheme cytochrome c family protein